MAARPTALQQRGCVFALRVGDDVGHRFRRELLLALEMRGSDGGQSHHPWQRREVAIVVDAGVEIGRNQHHSIHRDAELRLQIVRDLRAAEAAIAFADEILARTEAVVLHEPVVDDARQIFDVGLSAVEQLLRFRLRYQWIG